jgi:nondiscriminating glutamyl-tRNA synthetase
MNSTKIRTRFAPSPTGYLHVGGARTALYCYLYAKKTGGDFILRVEDTDEERSTEDSMKMQLADINWLGLNYVEGVDSKTLKDIGPYGPYRQSQRKNIYREYADKLLKDGIAYYCFMTDEEIDLQREQAMKEGRSLQLNSPYRNWTVAQAEAEMAKGKQATVRFKVPDLNREYSYTDLVRGEIKFPSDMVGDFVLLRTGGMPVYNFCNVIDDALMKVTHVFRGEEHLSNTLKQMMLYEALKFPLPQFGHLSIILGADRQKLSKRHGATSVNEYNERGYLPEAMNNFLALLGWSSPTGQEIMSMDEMISNFGTDRLHSASAVFDEVKLKWVNSHHLRALPHAELWKRLTPFFAKAGLILPQDSDWQDRSLTVFKTSMELLVDAVELYRPLSLAPHEVHAESKETLGWAKTREVVEKWKGLIAAHPTDYISEAEFVAYQDQVKDAVGVKGKELFMPIRVAVIGKPQGKELKILVPLMKKTVLVERADVVLKHI